MSQVDERVAKISFDNDAFEKRAATSLSTIDKLNEALQFKGQKDSFKNLSKLANTLSSSTLDISSSVQALSDRFSTFGIVGMQVIQNITNGLMNLGYTLVNKVYDPIVNGGKNRALNLEQARFMLNGLMTDVKDGAKQVEKILSGPVNDAVSGTRFGLDEAAVAASNLYASGVTDNNDLTKSLQAISGAASMTNREYSDMAQIFSTVKSNGQLMTMQLRQFATYGLNVSAELAKKMGKTEKEINDMVSKGKITYEDFVDVMYKYWDQASKANDTFAGSSANFRAALARIGAEFQSRNLVQMRKWFNSITPVINFIKKDIIPIAETVDKMHEKLRMGIMGLFVAGDEEHGFVVLQQLKDFLDALIGTFVSLGNVLSHTSETLATYLENIMPEGGFEKLTNGLNKLKAAIDGLIDPSNNLQSKIFGTTSEEMKEQVDYVQQVVDAVSTNRDKYMKDLTEQTKEYDESVKSVEAAEARLQKLEKKYEKKPSEKLEEKIVLQKKYIEELKDVSNNLLGKKTESEERYTEANEKVKELNNLSLQIQRNPIDEYLRSVAASLFNIGSIASNLVQPFKATNRITGFIESIGSAILQLQYNFENLTKELSEDTEFLNDIKRIGRGLFSIIRIGLQLINSIVKAITGVPAKIKSPIKSFTSFIAGIADWIYEADKFIEKTDLFTKAIDKIKAFLQPAIDLFKSIVQHVKDFFGQFNGNAVSFGDIITFIADKLNSFATSVDKAKAVVGSIKDIFGKVVEQLKQFSPVFDAIATVFESIFGVIKQIFQNTKEDMKAWTLFDLLNAILGLINAEAIATAIGMFRKFIQTISGGADRFRILFNNIADCFRELGNVLEVWQRSIKADVIFKIAVAIGILSLSLISLGNAENLDQAVSALGFITLALMALFTVYEKLNAVSPIALDGPKSFMEYLTKSFSSWLNMGRKSTDALVFIEIAGAVLILAAAVRVLAKAAENPGQMWQGVIAVGALLGMIMLVQDYLDDKSGMKPGSGLALILMAASLEIIADVIKKLADMMPTEKDQWNVLNGVLIIGLVMAEIAAFFWAMSKGYGNKGKRIPVVKGNDARKIATSMILIGAALEIIVDVIKKLTSLMSTEKDQWNIINALLVIELVFAEIASFFWALSKMKINGPRAKGLAASMILIGAALEIVTDVIKKISGMMTTEKDQWNVLNALLVMELIFAEIASFFLAMSLLKVNSRAAIRFGAALVIFGVAMEILADVVGKMAVLWTTNWEGAIAGLLMILSLLAIFGAFSNMTSGLDLTVTAQAILIFSAALLVMAGALQTVGTLNPEQILGAFLALASMVVVFGALATGMTSLIAVLAPGSMVLLAMAAALALFAVALGITVVAIQKFSKLSTDDVNQFFENFKLSLRGMKDILPELLTFVGAIFVGVLEIIASNAVKIATVITKLIISILTLVRDNIGQITSLVLEIFTAFVRAVGDNIDDIVAAGLYVIEQFLHGIAEGVPGLIDAAVDVIVAFIDGITNNLERVITAGTNLIVTLMWGIALQQATIIQTAKDIMGWFLDEIGATDVFEAGVNVIKGFINGIESFVEDVKTTAREVGNATLNTLRDVFDQHSPSKETEKIGLFNMMGLAKGTNGGLKIVKDAVKNIAGEYLDPLGNVQDQFVSLNKTTEETKKKTDKTTKSVKKLATAIKHVETAAEKESKLISIAFRNGLLSAKGSVSKAGKTLGTAFTTSLKSVVGNTKEYRKYIKELNKDVKKFINSSELTKYSKLGNKLYTSSDAYKQSLRELKGYYSEYRKLLKEMDEKKKKAKKGDKTSDESDQKRLKELEKNMEKVGKTMAKGPEKAIKSFRKEIKQTVKDFLAFSNISLGNVLDYQSKIKLASRTDSLIEGLSGTLRTASDVSKATSDQFDLMNISTETGINLLERFQKVSTVTVRRLMVNAKSQIRAFEEFQNGIQKLRESGLDSEFVDSLEAQGPQALGTIRGFGKMSAQEVATYNQLIEKQREYETKQLEKNMQKEEQLYAEYYANIEELAAKGLSEGIIKRLKEAGIEQSAFVKALLNMDGQRIENVNEFYERSVQAADQMDRIRDSENQTYGSFSEMLEAQIFQKNIWKLMLAKLKNAGIDSELIQTFKNMGYESGHEYVEEILKEIEQPGAAEKINASLQKLRDETDDPGTVWLKNMKTSRRSYNTYKKDMQELADSLPKGEEDPVYKYVKSLGWEEGAQYAEAFINSNKENQTRIRNEFIKNQKINRQQIKEQMEERMKQVSDWGANLEKIANKTYKKGSHKGETIIPVDFMSELVAMGPEAAAEIEAIAQMGNKEFNELCKQWGEASKLPESVSKMVTDSYAKTAGDAVTTFKEKTSGKDAKKNLTDASTNAVTTVGNNTAAAAKKSGEKVGKAAKDGVKTYVNKTKGEQIAGQMATGLSKGFEENTSMVKKAAKKLAKAAYDAMCKQLDSHSPSRKTIELGKYVAQGLGIGIEDNMDLAIDPATTLTDKLMTAFAQAANLIQNGTFGQFDYGINLVPNNAILDFSGNIAQASQIQDIFSSISGIDFEIGRDANREVVDELKRQSDRQVIFADELRAMHEDIMQMQLVMDSGALVGQIANPMNEALGERVALAQRGVLA